MLTIDQVIPPPPPVFNETSFAVAGNAASLVGARQLALEPSIAGADRAFSFSVWINPHNVVDNSATIRCFGVSEPASGVQQWVLGITPVSLSSVNQCLQFVIFGPSGSTSIQVISTNRILRGRWTHVCGTYDGSESQNGMELYINGVLDLTPTRSMGGSYVGANNSATLRMQLPAVFTGVGRFTGHMRDLALWNVELDQNDVDALFNDDLPFDVNTVSFYGADVAAYWPLRTNIQCLNNASYNFVSDVGISFTSQSISSTYPYVSMFNAIPGNTSYVSFGSLFKVGSVFQIKQRKGTDHVTAGDIVDLAANFNLPFVVGAPVVVINDALDLRNACAGVIGGNIVVFSARYNGTVQSVDYYTSTDGLTGLAFGARVDVTSLLPVTQELSFGKIISGPGAGEFMVAVYGNNGVTYHIGYLKRDTGGTWSYVSMYSGATPYTETSILNCGGGNFISMSRRESGGNGLYFMKSTDTAVTWTAPAASNVGGGVTMCDTMLTGKGRVVLLYADRSNGGVFISLNNVVADLLADPTDWNAGSQVFKNYAFGGNSILGYPSIYSDDGVLAAMCWSAEFSSTRADLFCCHGQVQY